MGEECDRNPCNECVLNAKLWKDLPTLALVNRAQSHRHTMLSGRRKLSSFMALRIGLGGNSSIQPLCYRGINASLKALLLLIRVRYDILPPLDVKVHLHWSHPLNHSPQTNLRISVSASTPLLMYFNVSSNARQTSHQHVPSPHGPPIPSSFNKTVKGRIPSLSQYPWLKIGE